MNNIFWDIQLFDIMGRIISCVVTTYVVFRFIDAKYIRVYNKKFIYIFIKVGCCLANLAVYYLNSPVANISFWIIVILLASRFLYFEEKISKLKYYFVNISFIFAYSICEQMPSLQSKLRSGKLSRQIFCHYKLRMGTSI